MSKRALFFFLVLILGVVLLRTFSLPSAQKTQETKPNFFLEHAVVSYVIDGDTVILESGEHVRLLGINATELGAPCSLEARDRLNQLVLKKTVTLERDVRNIDTYKRALRFLFASGANVNLTLLREGLVREDVFREDTKYREELDRAARDAETSKTGCLFRS